MPSPLMLSAMISVALAAQEHHDRWADDMSTLLRCAAADAGDDGKWLPLLQQTKSALLPDCACCPHPCGRGDDFDLASLQLETPAARQMKQQLADALPILASRSDISPLREALCLIGEYRTDENLRSRVDGLL